MTFEETEAHRGRFERIYTPRIERVLRDEGEAFATAIEAEDFPVSAFAKTDDLRKALEELYTDVIPHFAALSFREVETLKQFEGEEELWIEKVRRFIEREGGVMIVRINETTLKLVREILNAGLEQGWSFEKIAREMRKSWGEVSTVRAERIVRTESVRAGNYGWSEGAKEAGTRFGLELEKVWIAADDERTRESHRILDNVAVGMEDFFDVGGHLAQYPGDPSLPPEESIQCRCTLANRVKEQKNWRDDRDARMRAEFPKLKAKWGHVQALEELADQSGLSRRQVWRIVYEGTRS